MSLNLTVYDRGQPVLSVPLRSVLEVGRQDMERKEPAPQEGQRVIQVAHVDCVRLVVAGALERQVPRKFFRLEPQPNGMLLVRNLSDKVELHLGPQGKLGKSQSRVCDPPFYCEMGDKALRVDGDVTEELNLQSLNEPTLAPGRMASAQGENSLRSLMASVQSGGAAKASPGDFLSWLQASMDLFQSAATSEDFLSKATESAVDLIDLDVAVVMHPEKDGWREGARFARAGAKIPPTWRPSRTLLRKVTDSRETMFPIPASAPEMAQSAMGVHSFVAAPILDSSREVVAVFYGERRDANTLVGHGPIRELEAKLFALLAYGVASGLARADQERRIAAERVRFEQFFSPELARILQTEGEAMLAPREAIVTVLFCDVKDFSRISNEKGAAIAIEWLRDVLSMLTDCVADYEGVLVDYSGDALEALWGAPVTVPDHAARACRAAMQMIRGLARVNDRWLDRLGERTELTIGINSGPAQVGNIGSRRKFKYGAFGTTVNQASRVQSATKHVGCPMLVTQETAVLLAEEFPLRRLCRVETVNIQQPVDLYEFCPQPDARWPMLKARYEDALGRVEQKKFLEAIAVLGNLMQEFPTDKPTKSLMERCLEALKNPTLEFDPVWRLGKK